MAYMCADSGNLMAIAQQVIIQQQQQQQRSQPPPPPPFSLPLQLPFSWQQQTFHDHEPFQPPPPEFPSDEWMDTLIAGASPPPPLFADSDLDRIVFSHPSPPPPRLPSPPRTEEPIPGPSLADRPAATLLQSLLDCAAAGDPRAAIAKIRGPAPADGDPAQRVAHHFLNALAAPSSPSLDAAPEHCDTTTALCYKLLDDACPYSKFAHLTANQAILDATSGASVVHVVDFGVVHGVQWAALLQALATRPEGKPDKVRLSGVASPSLGTSHPNHSITATASRLSEFAESLELDFEFTPVIKPAHVLDISDFGVEEGESVVVNFMLQLHNWLSGEKGEPVVRRLLRLAKSLSPVIVTLCEHEVSLNKCRFADRFGNALSYFHAIFESIEPAMDRNSDDRARVELFLLGEQIKRAVGGGGENESMTRMAVSAEWKGMLEAAGFAPVRMSNYAVSQAELLLWNYDYSTKYSLVKSAPEFLSLAWAGRLLITVSAWR